MARVKKELGVDSQGIQKSMRFKDFVGDGAGMLSLNILSGLIGAITYFYTDEVGISAASVGTILLIGKIIDAFAQMFMGRIIDVTHSKYGKVRGWFLWMALPSALAIILLFTVPAHASQQMKFIYALLTNILAMSVVYSAVSIPYGSLLVLRTKSMDERGKMGIFRAIFGYIAGAFISIILIPITTLLGANQSAWIKVAVVFAFVSLLALLSVFKVSKEENINTTVTQGADGVETTIIQDESVSFLESLKYLFLNKYWVLMLAIALFINIYYSLVQSTGVYYAKYILHNADIVGLMGFIGLFPSVLGFIVIGPLVKKVGLAKACRIGLLVGIASGILRAIFPYSFIVTLIVSGVGGFATIPFMCLNGVMANNTVDYSEWKFGKRILGMNNSVAGFGATIGSGLGAAMIGWLLALGNYNGKLAVQAQPAINMILTISIYLPLILMVVSYVLLWFYDLEKIYPQMMRDLAQRSSETTDPKKIN